MMDRQVEQVMRDLGVDRLKAYHHVKQREALKRAGADRRNWK